MGTTHGGILATILDSAMTCAVQSVLPAGRVPTTLDLHVRYLRAVPPGIGRLEAEGRAVHVGGRVGTAEGRVTGEDGTLYATATTSCMLLDLLVSEPGLSTEPTGKSPGQSGLTR